MPSHATDTTIQMSGPGMLGKNTPGAGRSDLLSPDGVRAFAGVYSQEQVNAAFVSLAGAYSNPAWITAIDVAKVTGLSTTLASKADLVGGLVPAHQLPSYVDDVIEVADFGALPGTGEAGKIYVTLATSKTYRWSGSAYVELTDATAVWGQISGLVTNQTDLMNHLSTNYSSSGHTHTFASIQSKPTSLAGYGINDALSLSGGTLTGDLLFTDASYDIGKNGATRPRDGFFSRDLNAGGAITATGAINANGNIVFAPSPSSSGEIQRNGASNNQGVTLRETSTGAAIAVNPNTVSIYATSGLKLWNNIGTVAGPLECGAVTASGLLSLRDSTTPTELNLHSTFTSATSREYLRMLAVTGGAYQIGSAVGIAGGTNRAIMFGHWNAGGTFSGTASVTTGGRFSDNGGTDDTSAIFGAGTSVFLGGGSKDRQTVFGGSAQSLGPWSVVVGGQGITELGGVAIGASAYATNQSIAIGLGAGANGTSGGVPSSYGVNGYIILRANSGSAVPTAQYQFIASDVRDGYFGNGTTNASPQGFKLNATGGSGTNIAGANFTLAGGRGTGSAAGGSLIFQTAPAGSSGSSANALVDRLTIGATGTFTFGGGLTIGPFTGFGASTDYIQASSFWSVEPHLLGYPWHFGFDTSTTRVTIQTANSTTGVRVGSDGAFMFSSTTNSRTGTGDLFLMRDGAGVLAQRNSTNAQSFRVYNTYTSPTWFENLQFKANTGSAYQIGAAVGSAGGSLRDTQVGYWNSAGSFNSVVTVTSAGNVGVNTTAPAGQFDVRFTRTGTGPDVTSGQTITASSNYGGSNTSTYYGAVNAINDLVGGADQDAWGSNYTNVTNQWLRVQFNTARVIVRLTVVNGSVPSPGAGAQRCEFQGSNDGTTWTKLPAIAVFNGPTIINTDEFRLAQNAISKQVVEFNNSTAYLYYRLFMYNNWGNVNFILIQEIEMMEPGNVTYADPRIFSGQNIGFGTTSPTSFVEIVPPAQDTGTATAFTLTGAAHTGLQASTESSDVNFNLARIVQFNAGALATQRAFRIQAPTYAFVTASTVTTASTLSISGAPAAGTNATITSAYALNVESGNSYFGGSIYQPSLQWMYFGGAALFRGSPAILQLNNASITNIAQLEFTSNNDVVLVPEAANTLSLRRSTSAQEFRIYTTYTSATSYERIEIKGKSGANFEIGPENGSAGGTLRGLTIGGYSAGSSTITPWLTFTNAGAATFSGMISTSNSGILLSEVIIRRSTAGGIIEIADNSENFNRLQLGGRTSAYPAIKRSSAAVALRLADDSADAALTCAGITASDSVTTNGLFSSDRYAVSANYRFRRANGTSGSPTQVTSGQAVGALSSFGYHDGGAFHSSAGAILYFVAAESFTASGHGTNLQFWTTPVTSTTSAKRVTIEASGELTLEAGSHIQTSGAGIKIGTATSQKLGFWNATPVAQPTTAVAAATVAGVGGVGVSTLDTFDGYTIGQVVRALRNTGILA